WIRNFTRLVQPYVDGLVPKMGGVYHVDEMLLHVRKENNEQMMNDNQENHTHKFFDNHYSWLWNLMDSKTRFWICSRLSRRRDIQAGVALLMRDRETVMRGLDNADAGQELLDA